MSLRVQHMSRPPLTARKPDPLRPHGLIPGVIVCLLVLLLGVRPSLAADPVVIGAVYNLTGSMASIDGPGLEGMKLAVEHINAKGGVLGRPLKLEVRDGGSDLKRCKAAVQELAKAKVSAMAGLNDSDYAFAAGKAAAKARIPFVTAGATLPSLPRSVGPYFFMACFDDKAQAKAVAKFALRRLGAGSMLVLTDKDSSFAVALARYFCKAYAVHDGLVTAKREFSPSDPDPLSDPVLNCIAGGTCQGAFVAGVPEDVLPTVAALRAAGFTGAIFSGDGFDTPLLDQIRNMASPGVYFSTHVSYDNPRPQVQDFVNAWEKAYGSKPQSGFAALGYDAVGLIADAVARAGSDAPDKVRAALAATRNYPGVTGEIGYPDPLSPPRKPVVIVRYDKGGRTFEKEVLP
ncbi:ABC transporter substrate-binding protein [Fundidesulfovibrio butyratiphilus]